VRPTLRRYPISPATTTRSGRGTLLSPRPRSSMTAIRNPLRRLQCRHRCRNCRSKIRVSLANRCSRCRTRLAAGDAVATTAFVSYSADKLMRRR